MDDSNKRYLHKSDQSGRTDRGEAETPTEADADQLPPVLRAALPSVSPSIRTAGLSDCGWTVRSDGEFCDRHFHKESDPVNGGQFKAKPSAHDPLAGRQRGGTRTTVKRCQSDQACLTGHLGWSHYQNAEDALRSKSGLLDCRERLFGMSDNARKTAAIARAGRALQELGAAIVALAEPDEATEQQPAANEPPRLSTRARLAKVVPSDLAIQRVKRAIKKEENGNG